MMKNKKNRVRKRFLLSLIVFSTIILTIPSLQIQGQVNQNEEEDNGSTLLTNTLKEPMGIQGFVGGYALNGNPDEIVEIIVQFHTPPAVALQLMSQRGIPVPLRLTGATFEEQALTAHDEFAQQLGGLVIPYSISGEMEIFCETYWIFNGVHMRVPTAMVEQIAELPEVFVVTPYVLPAIPTSEVSEPEAMEMDVQNALPSARTSPFFQNDELMRNTRDVLNLDSIHLDMNITGRGVVVASSNTGVDHGHPEFIRFHDDTGRVPGWQFYGYDPDHGSPINHGTQTTGSIIAMAPEIELWVLQTASSLSSGGTAIGAIDFATQTVNADIIQTWGGFINSPFDPHAAAVSLAVEAGHLVVAAAGNNGQPDGSITEWWWGEDLFEGVLYNGIIWHSVINPLSPLAINVGAGTFGSDFFPTDTDNLLDWSSRGPVPRTFQIKPDIIANGLWGNSTMDRNVGLYYGPFNGTSLASPLTTGITALLVQQFPDDSPHEIKARLMNTGRPITGIDLANSSSNMSVFSAGAGFVQPYYALQSNTVVTVAHDVPLTANPDDLWIERDMSSFSFGSLGEILPSNSRTFRASIHNQSSEPITYIIGDEIVNNPEAAAAITFSQRIITVEPNQTEHFYVGISVADNVQGDITAFYEGHIHVDGGSHSIRLPFALVNPSTTNVAASMLGFDLDGGTVTLNTPDQQTGIDAINVLHGENILDFLAENHNGFTEPTKEGFTFAGWYLDSDFETPLTEETIMPAWGLTLYARWESSIWVNSTEPTGDLTATESTDSSNVTCPTDSSYETCPTEDSDSGATCPTNASAATDPNEQSNNPSDSSNVTCPTEDSNATCPTDASASTDPSEPSTDVSDSSNVTCPTEDSNATCPTDVSAATDPGEPSTDESDSSNVTCPTEDSNATCPTDVSASTDPSEPSTDPIELSTNSSDSEANPSDLETNPSDSETNPSDSEANPSDLRTDPTESSTRSTGSSTTSTNSSPVTTTSSSTTPTNSSPVTTTSSSIIPTDPSTAPVAVLPPAVLPQTGVIVGSTIVIGLALSTAGAVLVAIEKNGKN